MGNITEDVIEETIEAAESAKKKIVKDKGPKSVITIPLKTEKWQEDIFIKRFDGAYRSIYNAMLRERLDVFHKMIEMPEYKAATEVINKIYAELGNISNKDEKEKRKKELQSTPEYKEAVATQNRIRKELLFTEFDFGKISLRARKHFEDVTSAKVTEISVGKPMWAAFDKAIFSAPKDEEDRPEPHYKKYGSIRSLTSDGKSGLMIVDEEGVSTLQMSSDRNKKYYLRMKTKAGKTVLAPLVIDKKNTYLLEMMEKRIKQVRLIRKKVKGNWKYSVQLVVKGVPAMKYDKEGNLKHTAGDEKVAIFINSNNIAIATKDTTSQIFLAKNFDEYKAKIAELQKYMDNSRRISNPEFYNEDGTFKREYNEDGTEKKVKRHWRYSNGYKKALAEKANIERIMAEQRKIQNNIIANDIIALGTDITINRFKVKEAAEKAKYDKTTKKGTQASKKRAGKLVSENAPAYLMTAIDNRLKAMDLPVMKRVNFEPEEYKTEDITSYAEEIYKKHCL